VSCTAWLNGMQYTSQPGLFATLMTAQQSTVSLADQTTPSLSRLCLRLCVCVCRPSRAPPHRAPHVALARRQPHSSAGGSGRRCQP
jgi:hypothetical protein